MVRLNRIYTRTGDDGLTGLATGERVKKWSLRVAAYGTVDEVNAALGLAALHAEDEMAAAIHRVQNDLFDLGADLSTPERETPLEFEALRVTTAQVDRLEAEIDEMNAAIPPLDSFILPGGSPLAANLHMARTICRRAERLIAELASMENEKVSDAACQYANRLSDWLFVAARAANANGAEDVKWVPGGNR
jgi:cob(I)alamin adenosyltransferase